MRAKHLVLTALGLTAVIIFSASSSQAGEKQRYRWEGFAMGVGAAAIGHHILAHGHPAPLVHTPPPHPVQYHQPPVYHPKPNYRPPSRHRHYPKKIVHHHYHGHRGKHGKGCKRRHHGRHRHHRPVKVVHHHYYN